MQFLSTSGHSIPMFPNAGTIVVCWTAGQQVEQSILHLEHENTKIHIISPCWPRPSIALQCKILVYSIIHLLIFPGYTIPITHSLTMVWSCRGLLGGNCSINDILSVIDSHVLLCVYVSVWLLMFQVRHLKGTILWSQYIFYNLLSH